MNKKSKFVIICFSLFLACQAYSRDFSFEWTANPEPFTGYELHYKISATDSSPPFDGVGLIEGASPILVPKVITYTVTGADPEKTYHFALVAYNGSEKSGYSDLVTVGPGDSPIIIRMQLLN